MAEQEGKALPREEEAPEAPEAPQAELSNDFFAQLLHLPACKSKGYCDNCGRCER